MPKIFWFNTNYCVWWVHSGDYLWQTSSEILFLSVINDQIINQHLILDQKRPSLIVFTKKYMKNYIWHLPQGPKTVFGSSLVKYSVLEYVLVIILHQHQIANWKRSNSATFRQILLEINMERGPGTMGVAWVQLGWIKNVYQAFSNSLRYMDFFSKV